MPKYTVEDLSIYKWENQMEKDIKQDLREDKFAFDQGDSFKHLFKGWEDSIADQWTNPLKHLFGGELHEGGNPIINNANYTNTRFDNYWKEKMRRQQYKK